MDERNENGIYTMLTELLSLQESYKIIQPQSYRVVIVAAATATAAAVVKDIERIGWEQTRQQINPSPCPGKFNEMFGTLLADCRGYEFDWGGWLLRMEFGNSNNMCLSVCVTNII